MLSGRSSIHRESSSPKAMRIRHGCQSFVTAFSVGGRTRPTCTRDHGAKFGNPHRYLRARCMARAPHSVSADLPHTIMRPSHRPSAWTTRPPTKDASGTRYESWPMALFWGMYWGRCWPALFERHTRIQWVADTCACTVCMPERRGPHGHPPKTCQSGGTGLAIPPALGRMVLAHSLAAAPGLGTTSRGRFVYSVRCS